MLSDIPGFKHLYQNVPAFILLQIYYKIVNHSCIAFSLEEYDKFLSFIILGNNSIQTEVESFPDTLKYLVSIIIPNALSNVLCFESFAAAYYLHLL